MSPGPFLAVDWGTTNCRAWVVDGDGRPGPRRDFPLGVSRLGTGEAAARFRDTVRPAMGAERLPALLAGMIGSTRGWVEAPYVGAPVDAAALAARLLHVPGENPPVALVPGVRCLRPDGAPDVMRGEETQVLGWLEADPARRRGSRLVYHPGTHGKWVRTRDGRIDRFATVMTGELFALLTAHGVLRSEPPPPEAAPDWEAFGRGLAQAAQPGGVTAQLFTARSRVVVGDLPAASQRDYLSGLLVGSDLAAGAALLGPDPDESLALLGEPALCERYARACAQTGRACETFDGDAAFLQGLRDLARRGALESTP